MYSLMTYGIPHHLIPATAEGQIKVKNHLEFIDTRKTKEEYAVNSGGHGVETIELPLASDVLLGKGKPIQEHTGNLRLHAIVEEYLSQYRSSSRPEKTALATEVVRAVKSASGRFLSKESGIWIEVDENVAREKVSNIFRHCRKVTPKTDMGAKTDRVRTNVEANMLDDFNGKRIKLFS
jgi:hypothetical protein